MRWLLSLLFRRRQTGMPSLCGYDLQSRLTVALIDASDRRSALR